MPTFLLTWNPTKFNWKAYSRFAAQVAEQGEGTTDWSAGGTKQIRRGDRLFFLRQGSPPTGIVGSGVAASDWYENKQWDGERAGQSTTYVKVKFDRLVDVDANPKGVLSTETLNELVPGLQTNVQRSGTRIDDDIAIAVEQLWQPDTRLRLQRHDQFPETMSEADILSAIRYFDRRGYPPTFGPSTDYDLLHEGRRYPPKVIAALAARVAQGRMLFSTEFRGGEGTPCFRVLSRHGFRIVPKSTTSGPFRVGDQYTRRQVQELIGVPPATGGDWATGHHREGNDTFIFATIGSAGRTGHQYDNRWVGDELWWETKGTLTQEHEPVKAMLSPPNGGHVYIFTRENDRDSFTFEGTGTPARVEGNRPVKIVWRLADARNRAAITAAGEVLEPARYWEGATRTVAVNVYERNPAARRACIAHYGCCCAVCGFDFEASYGAIGEGFIHVHHLKPLHEVDAKYVVDPLHDLRPVCPNCHAMLHTQSPPLSIEALRELLEPKTGMKGIAVSLGARTPGEAAAR